MGRHILESSTASLSAMVFAGVLATLFLVTAAVFVRISLLPIDIQLGSVFPLPLLLLVASVRSLFKEFAVARESPDGLRNFNYGLLIQLGVAFVLCVAVFLVKV